MTGESSNADGVKSTERRGSGQAVTDNSQQTTGNVTSAQLTAAIDAHESASNPHPAYLTQPEGDARYVQLGAALVNAAAVEALTFSATPTQAECEALRNAVAVILETLRVHS